MSPRATAPEELVTKPRVHVIALGSDFAGDDDAALEAAGRLHVEGVRVTLAGRAGADLLELLEPAVPTVLTDVVRTGRAPGSLLVLDLDALTRHTLATPQTSSHGLGPAEALRLMAALGRELPRGRFVGLEGSRFAVGTTRSNEVEAALDALEEALRAAVAELQRNPE